MFGTEFWSVSCLVHCIKNLNLKMGYMNKSDIVALVDEQKYPGYSQSGNQ